MKKKNQFKMKGAFLFLLSFLMIVAFYNCSDDDNVGIVPPDPNTRTILTTFFPDSGGMATKLILCGRNFGTDTSYMKVTVNGKKSDIDRRQRYLYLCYCPLTGRYRICGIASG